jgi:hypothetical protein
MKWGHHQRPEEHRMGKSIKSIGLAVAAAAALSALAAPGAQAGSFDIGTQPAFITGQSEAGQEHILTVMKTSGGNFTAKCKSASFEGTSVGQAISEATITPTYGPNCVFAGIASQVLANGCKFTITGLGQPANTTNLDIAGCTAGKQIETKTAACTFHIPEQTGLSHIVATNIGGNEVTLSATLSTITFSQTGVGCPDGNNHHSNQATISGNTIIKAYKHGGTQQVTKHSHQYAEGIIGEQVSLATT